MNNSHRFFANKECKYYPCHTGINEMNCLFCYCPLYTREECPGNPCFITKKGIHSTESGADYENNKNTGKTIKNCSACTFPHIPENYDKIIDYLKG